MKPTPTLILSSVAIVLIALTFFPFQIPFVRNVYNNVILDRYDHWLPCHKLPTTEEIEATTAQHEETLERLYAVDPSGRPGISIYVDNETCEGRGDLIIEYGAHHHREQIEEILGDQTFFGIPVRLRNI